MASEKIISFPFEYTLQYCPIHASGLSFSIWTALFVILFLYHTLPLLIAYNGIDMPVFSIQIGVFKLTKLLSRNVKESLIKFLDLPMDPGFWPCATRLQLFIKICYEIGCVIVRGDCRDPGGVGGLFNPITHVENLSDFSLFGILAFKGLKTAEIHNSII